MLRGARPWGNRFKAHWVTSATDDLEADHHRRLTAFGFWW
jgi:hypothetical protein